MIISSAPTNEAVLSNVGAVSEFTIKATAKSFRILSDGLYANKVRAIIRELSCNALDSHIANGNPDIPFVVHLPNSLEPYFSVRDFGTGLDNDQVTSIFTSFFTSTKTDSNDFIGALGLGSKSPFSYTDNFTVTAIKNGRKGIYTAFINDGGVPSIALMMSEESTEPSGVEVRFAVTDRYDFVKFVDEARDVYKFWRNRPTITGSSGFEFIDPVFEDEDIIPGVHAFNHRYAHQSLAIMGNIAYPISIPDTETSLGDLRYLLDCSLVMEFCIGELDFQASREGLSYVPLTVNSIRAKLTALNAQLAVRIAADADKIENLWERADYLHKRIDEPLWRAAVTQYLADTGFPLLNTNRWNSFKRFKLKATDLETNFNIVVKGFSKSRGVSSCKNLNADLIHSQQNPSYYEWEIRAEMNQFFVFNDTKVGALERAKFHWRNREMKNYSEAVYVLEPADRTKPMKQEEFLAEIMNPPATNVMMASSLMRKERAGGMGRNVSILLLESHSRGWRYSDRLVWTDAGSSDRFDSDNTYYYVPLSGFTPLGKVDDIKVLKEYLYKSEIYRGEIYGVRKSDIDEVRAMPNWVPLDTLVESKLAALDGEGVMGLVKQAIDFDGAFHWKLGDEVPATSPYSAFVSVFKDVKYADRHKMSNLQILCRLYGVATATTGDPTELIAKYQAEKNAIFERYPLLKAINRYSAEDDHVAQYINMIDLSKNA